MQKNPQSLTREDWVRVGFQVLKEHGVDSIKVVRLADRLNVTSGSFYWHFEELPELLDNLLEYWEHEWTDAFLDAAREFDGSPRARILNFMLQVIAHDAASVNQSVPIWTRRLLSFQESYLRVLTKWYEFAVWMFGEAGFDEHQSTIRGRLLVAYLMGESSTDLKTMKNWKTIINDEFELMIKPDA